MIQKQKVCHLTIILGLFEITNIVFWDSINPRLKEDILGRCGMYAKVLKEGTLAKGEIIQSYVSSSVNE